MIPSGFAALFVPLTAGMFCPDSHRIPLNRAIALTTEDIFNFSVQTIKRLPVHTGRHYGFIINIPRLLPCT